MVKVSFLYHTSNSDGVPNFCILRISLLIIYVMLNSVSRLFYTELFRKFYGHLLQFQLYEAFCIQAKEYIPNSSWSAPLNKCNFFDNKEIGQRLSE